jgi:hypothetical protein
MQVWNAGPRQLDRAERCESRDTDDPSDPDCASLKSNCQLMNAPRPGPPRRQRSELVQDLSFCYRILTPSNSFNRPDSTDGPHVESRTNPRVTHSSRKRRIPVNEATYSRLNQQRDDMTWISKLDCVNSNLAIARH